MKLKTYKLVSLLTLVLLLPLFSGCFEIVSVEQADTVDPGEQVSVTVKVKTDGTDENAHYGIVGLLVPNDWAVDLVHYTGDFGPDTCSFLDPGTPDAEPSDVDYWTDSLEVHYPSGENMQWMVYQANTAYASAVETGNIDLMVDFTAGATKGTFNLGYFVSNSGLDFTDPSYYSLKYQPVGVGGPMKHLLISEFVVTPTDKEFIEIYNGTGADIDLTNYYLSDALYNGDNDYINVVDGSYTAFGSDFLAKFPDGAMIADGEFLVVATDGAGFLTEYGIEADFELRGTSDTVADMVPPKEGDIGASAGLSNGGESIILFYWDGASDLVQDVDYVIWGDKAEYVDKTGVIKDGPDADTDASAYMDDTPEADQIAVSPDTPHESGKSAARQMLEEMDEVMSGGNGIGGHDETSEDLAAAFRDSDPTPGESPTAGFVNVTFLCNTAAWRDTVKAGGLVQLRGTTITEAGQSNDDASVDTLSEGTIINWGALSTMYLENAGGDYWKATFQIPAGTKMAYKFFVNAQHSTVQPGDEWEHAGWEGNITNPPGIYSGNRGLDLTNFAGSDTTMPVQFANGWKGQLDDQYERPYETQDSTFVVYVRVNMAGWEDFTPSNHVVGVRGSNMSDWGDTGEISWGKTYALNREGTSGMAGFFYSGAIHVPDEYATAGVKFKFVVHNAGNPLDEDWGNMVYNPNTEYEVTTTGVDTTIHWKWFDNLAPKQAEHPDEIIVNYVVDMKNAVANRGFTLGDTLQVRMGYNQSADERYDLYLKRQGSGTIYAGSDTVQSMIDREMYYQYYSEINGVQYREIYFNFEYEDKASNNAERREFLPDTNVVTILDTLNSVSAGRRMPLFRSVEIIAQDSIAVTLTCDVRPAIYQVLMGDTLVDIQGNNSVMEADSVMAWGVAVNGPLTGGWSSAGGDWGRHLMDLDHKALHDDGLNGDAVAGDSIFSIQFMMYKDSTTQTNGPSNIVGQEFKFGIGGGDNEGGYGNNHIVNVDDSEAEVVIDAQFGSIDPLFYWAWDYDNRRPNVSVDVDETAVDLKPVTYKLEQNYPNPFNPTTTINYAIPRASEVTLKVFNMMGQEVKTLVSKKQNAGIHQVQWDGTNNSGTLVSTGLYMYRIEAGDFVKIKKMMLIK